MEDKLTTALTTTSGDSGELDSVLALGKALAASRYFKEAADPAKAAVKILYGRELGLGPVQALQSIDFNEKGGSLSLRAHAMAALIRKSNRYDYRVTKGPDETGCEITYYMVEYDQTEFGPKRKLVEIGKSSFGPADAKRAGLSGRATYQQHTYDMYYNRAMAKGARMHCPDVFGAPVYIEDEVANFVGQSTGKSKQAHAAPVEEPIEAKAVVVKDAPAGIPATAPVTLEGLGIKDPETVPEALRPDGNGVPDATAEEIAKAREILAAKPHEPSADEIAMGDIIPVDMARRIFASAPGTVLLPTEANDFHGYLVDFLGGGDLGRKAAQAAWKAVGVTLAKGTQVTREQAVAVAAHATNPTTIIS